MLNARLHKILILLLLLAFTSQTMATAAMNCEQEKTAATDMHMDMSDMTGMDMSKMDHMRHMSKIDAPQNSHHQFDCCKTMGHCLFGGCSLAAASHGIVLSLQKINSVLEDFYSGAAPAPLVSSLYRPPIFC
jgi:uncharacterized protein involved in copper resistance